MMWVFGRPFLADTFPVHNPWTASVEHLAFRKLLSTSDCGSDWCQNSSSVAYSVSAIHGNVSQLPVEGCGFPPETSSFLPAENNLDNCVTHKCDNGIQNICPIKIAKSITQAFDFSTESCIKLASIWLGILAQVTSIYIKDKCLIPVQGMPLQSHFWCLSNFEVWG